MNTAEKQAKKVAKRKAKAKLSKREVAMIMGDPVASNERRKALLACLGKDAIEAFADMTDDEIRSGEMLLVVDRKDPLGKRMAKWPEADKSLGVGRVNVADLLRDYGPMLAESVEAGLSQHARNPRGWFVLTVAAGGSSCAYVVHTGGSQFTTATSPDPEDILSAPGGDA